MKSRKPQPPAPAAFDAFVSGAEPHREPRAESSAQADLPWLAPGVRNDVVKSYPLRLPEPLYLQLKWAAAQTGQSVNALCKQAIADAIAPHLP